MNDEDIECSFFFMEKNNFRILFNRQKIRISVQTKKIFLKYIF